MYLQKVRARAQEKGGVGALLLLLLLVLCSESQGGETEEGPSVSLSLHTLNVLTGLPAEGLPMRFSQLEDPDQPWTELMNSTTKTDGRLDMAPRRLKAGTYKLRFDTAAYWRQQGYASFYPYVDIVFTVTEAEGHVHVPLLLSPYSYTTYRGS